MPVSIRDARHSPQDRDWIRELRKEYLDNLARTASDTGNFPILDANAIDAQFISAYFTDVHAFPLTILKDNQRVGFALVQQLASSPQSGEYRMAEFFITLEARRLGIGRDAALLIFRRFTGKWEISEATRNKPAVAFWRSIVAEFTSGRFREVTEFGEVRQQFVSRSKGSDDF